MSGVLREIVAKFIVGFDSKEVQKGHKHVESTIDKLKELGEVVIAGFAIEKIVEFGKELLESAETLKVTSLALGTTTEELQGLDHAAQQSGVGVDELHSALGRLQKGAAEAATKGASPVAVALKKLGVALKDEDGNVKTSGELFTDVADRISDIKGPTERAGIAAAIFGRSYTRILPVLLKGKDGIAELTKEVGELGFGMDEAFIENSEDILHNVDRLKKGIRGIAIQAIGPLLPGLVKITEEGVAFAKSLVQGIKHTEALKTAFVLLTGKGLVTLISKLGGAGGLVGILRTLGTIALRTVAPFLILEDALTFLTGGKSVTGDFFDKIFGKDTTSKFQAGIGQMLADWNESADQFAVKWQQTVDGMPLPMRALFDVITIGFQAITGQWDAFGLGGMKSFDKLRAGWSTLVAWINPLNIGKSWDELLNNSWKDIDAENSFNRDALAESGGTPDVQRTGTTEIDQSFRTGVTQVEHAKGKKNPGQAAAIAAGKSFSGPELAYAPIPGPVTNNTTVNTTNKPTINVNVPPGTPADLAQDVGDAAHRGVVRGIDFRAAHAALVPQAG